MTLENALAEAVAILQDSQQLVALTGAGISVPSGIPDFRSPKSGLWAHYDPMEVATIHAFKQNPARFYEWIRPLINLMTTAEPNPAHYALVDLEKQGLLKAIITQNIDVMHSKAGSETIYEVHGHIREATCIRCFTVYASDAVMWQPLKNGKVPTCPDCGNVLKPNVILFGEMLPVSVLNNAKRAARQCDAMLVIGSSLEVAPSGDLPLLAKQVGAKLIFVNFGETQLDQLADIIIRADAAEIIPALAAPFLTQAGSPNPPAKQ